MDIFAFFPTTALGCYLIILFGILSVRATTLKKIFISVLSVYIMWTLGSVCMRLGVWPSLEFWFHVSLSGIYLIPVGTLFFMEMYMYGKVRKFSVVLLGIDIAAYVSNLVTGGWMVPAPRAVDTAKGVQFVYEDIGIQSVIPYIGYVVVTAYLIWVLRQGVKDGILRRVEFFIVVLGKVLLLVGNLLINLPVFSGIPIDMAMGIPDAFTIMLMVGLSPKIRMFRETSRNSNKIFRLGISVALTLLFMLPCNNFIESFLGEWGKQNHAYLLAIGALVFYVVTYWVVNLLMEALFIKDGELQMLRLNEFQKACHQTLDINSINELIKQTAKQWLEAEWTELLVWDAAENVFMAKGTLPDGKQVLLPNDKHLVEYIKQQKHVLILEDFEADYEDSGYGKYLYELKRRGTALLQPFCMEDDLYAVLIASKGEKKYRTIERHTMDMMAKISMEAIQNARLYDSVYREARTDALIGIGNRKYFYEIFDMVRENGKSFPLTVALVKLDDLRICNRLYGIEGGDRALKRVAALLQQKVKRKNTVFRYGAGEFLVLLENIKETTAKELMEEVRLQVMQINDLVEYNQLMLTISVGISSAQNSGQISEKLLDNCAKALFSAQQRGKNCVVVYGEMEKDESAIRTNPMFAEYEAVFRALTTVIDAKDHYTASHSQNVSYYATELARALKLSPEEVEIVKEAGLLHDIGKIGIPEAILQKPGRLTDEEFIIMKSHVEQSVEILHHLSGMEYILPAVLGHHEKYDGTGYPLGKKGEDIPLSGRILNVVDSFDAMMSARPYKPPYPVEFALHQLLVSSGTQFDPEIAKVFAELIRDGKITVRKSGLVK